MSKLEHAIQTALEIICQLHNQNKTISVAAVRNKALLPLPLPAITKAVSAFKENPDTYLDAWRKNNTQASEQPATNQAQANQTNLTLEQRVEQLEQQVAQLQQTLNQVGNKIS